MKNGKMRAKQLVDENGRLVCEGGFEKLQDTRLDRASVRAVELRFIDEIGTCLGYVKQFPNLESLLILHARGEVGAKDYGQLAELTGLRKLSIRDVANFDTDSMKVVAAVPNLAGLELMSMHVACLADLELIGGIKSLRELRFDNVTDMSCNEPFVEDLKFVEKMEELEVLDISGCDHIDLSKFVPPKGLKKIVVPRYATKGVRARLMKRCRVEVDGPECCPNSYRFVREEDREKTRKEAKECARQKRLQVAAEHKIQKAFAQLIEGLEAKGCALGALEKVEKAVVKAAKSCRVSMSLYVKERFPECDESDGFYFD